MHQGHLILSALAQKYSVGSQKGIFLPDFHRDVNAEKSGEAEEGEAMAGARGAEMPTEQHQALEATVIMISLSDPKIPSTIPF